MSIEVQSEAVHLTQQENYGIDQHNNFYIEKCDVKDLSATTTGNQYNMKANSIRGRGSFNLEITRICLLALAKEF